MRVIMLGIFPIWLVLFPAGMVQNVFIDSRFAKCLSGRPVVF